MLVCLIKWLQPMVLKWLTLSGQSLRRPCRVGGSHVFRLNFKTSHVGVYKCLSLIVGFAVTVAIWQREVVSCHDFILRAVATFWPIFPCRNLPWQGLTKDRASQRKMEHKERPVPYTLQLEILVPALCYHTETCRILCRKGWHPVDMFTCFV